MSEHSTNSNTNSRSNEEESTTFRSIPLVPGSVPMPMTRSLSPLRQPLGLAPLPLLRKRNLDLPSKSTAAAVAASSSSFSWKVNEEEVPSVPEYPLELTYMSCPASLPLDQITQRIARMLEAQSLQCVFFPRDHSADDENDMDTHEDMDEVIIPGRVDCSSASTDLKFVLQIYKNRHNSDEEETFVVEMQRRRGSSLDFSAVRKALFRVLSSTTTTTERPTKAFAPRAAWSPPPFVPNKRFRVMPGSLSLRS